jgi:hypothetical protein
MSISSPHRHATGFAARSVLVAITTDDEGLILRGAVRCVNPTTPSQAPPAEVAVLGLVMPRGFGHSVLV